MRFLNDEQTDKSTWGRMFPIVALNARDARPAVAGNLSGAEGPHSVIDSGFDTEGWLMPQFTRSGRMWRSRRPAVKRVPNARFSAKIIRRSYCMKRTLESDAIGLSLARHLVTLDFPNHALYLKRTSDGPLPNIGVVGAINYLKALKEQGQVARFWLREEPGRSSNIKFDPATNTTAVDTLKDGDPSIYHYLVRHKSGGNSWKLQRAWRTDQSGKTVEEFSAP